MNILAKLMTESANATEEKLEAALRAVRGEVAATPSPRIEGPLLLGMGAAAKHLGVSRPTMWRMIRDGRLEKVEILPGSYRMRRADLDRYVAEHGTTGTQPTRVDGDGNCGGQAA